MPAHKQPIWDRLLRYSEVDVETGCWNWTANRTKGYGRVWIDGRTCAAHRASYEWAVGPIPEGLQIDHLCKNPSCINPVHLEAVPGHINMRRADTYQAHNHVKTRCKRGHPLEGDNLYRPPKKPWERHCKTCQRERAKRRVRPVETRQCVICGQPFQVVREKKESKTCSHPCRGKLISRTKTASRGASSGTGPAQSRPVVP